MYDNVATKFPASPHKKNWKTFHSFVNERSYLTEQTGSYEQWVFEPVGKEDREGHPLYRIRSVPHGSYLRAMPMNHPDFKGQVDAISWPLEGTEWAILGAYHYNEHGVDDDIVYIRGGYSDEEDSHTGWLRAYPPDHQDHGNTVDLSKNRMGHERWRILKHPENEKVARLVSAHGSNLGTDPLPNGNSIPTPTVPPPSVSPPSVPPPSVSPPSEDGLPTWAVVLIVCAVVAGLILISYALV